MDRTFFKTFSIFIGKAVLDSIHALKAKYNFTVIEDAAQSFGASYNEKKSGITIHYVDDSYDTGKIIFQKEVEISESDSVEEISKKVHNLELEYFPKVIESILFKV